jgi:hypothetical protein
MTNPPRREERGLMTNPPRREERGLMNNRLVAKSEA